jgi:uncharacterized protein YqeY
MRTTLRKALTTAMKERDAVAISVLRTTMSALDNAEAVEVPEGAPSGSGPIAGAVAGHGAGDVARRELSEREMTGIVAGELAERQALAAQYHDLGRTEDAARLRREAAILDSFLKEF